MAFRRDSFLQSFGHSHDFDGAEYLKWLKQKMKEQTDGFLLVEEDGGYVGQMELTIKKYKGSDIGYINLYYLTEPYRGKGYAPELHNYAELYFEEKGTT